MTTLPRDALYNLCLLKHGPPPKPNQKHKRVDYAYVVFPDWYRHRGQQKHRLDDKNHEHVLNCTDARGVSWVSMLVQRTDAWQACYAWTYSFWSWHENQRRKRDDR